MCQPWQTTWQTTCRTSDHTSDQTCCSIQNRLQLVCDSLQCRSKSRDAVVLVEVLIDAVLWDKSIWTTALTDSPSNDWLQAGSLISKYRVLPILYADIFLISMELSPIFLKRVIDKVSAILLGRKYRDTNTFPRPATTLERRKHLTIGLRKGGFDLHPTPGSRCRKARNTRRSNGATLLLALACDTDAIIAHCTIAVLKRFQPRQPASLQQAVVCVLLRIWRTCMCFHGGASNFKHKKSRAHAVWMVNCGNKV